MDDSTTDEPAVSGTDAFDEIVAWADPAMVIVTTIADDELSGCLVGFHSQAAIEPRQLCVWLSRANHTFAVAARASVFAVHHLCVDDMDIATTFGTTSGDNVDKFRIWRWNPGPHGVPLLEACPNRVVGRAVTRLESTGDHVGIVLEPLESHFDGRRPPLRLHHVSELDPGHDAAE